MFKKKPVCGVGINNADFPVYHFDHRGLRREIPSYSSWKHMIARCYSQRRKDLFPTYQECISCEEWVYFMSFHEWYVAQEKEAGWHLDKDLLFPGNKLYSPETCIYVHPSLNMFTTDTGAKRGDYMLGVSLHESGKFKAQCQNPFTHKKEHIGLYNNEIDAHLAWKRRKHELSCQWAEMVKDERLKKALKTRYAEGIA